MPTMLFAAEEVTNGGSAGWFLTHAWLIPVIPAVGFAVIILIGKRLPRKGSEVGIAALAAAFVLALGTAIQWIQRVEDAGAGEGALGLVAQHRPVDHAARRGSPRRRGAGRHELDVVAVGRHDVRHRHLHRRPRCRPPASW